MKHEERLNRMLETGIISEEQYSSLLKSLDNEQAIENTMKKHSKPAITSLIISIVFPLVIVLLFFIFSNGGEVEAITTVQNIKEIFNQGKVGAMSSTSSNLSIILFLGIFLLLPVISIGWMHNGLVKEEETIHTSWSQVESNYQRRADLIPNLIETVLKYLKHEKSTFESVTEKRGGDMSETIAALINAQKESSELFSESDGEAPEDDAYISLLGASQKRVGQMMHKIMLTAEAYPDLRSSDQMQQLQAQLEGTENRINVARIRFNEAVGAFNASIRRMPTSMVASFSDFNRKAYFKADEGTDKAVKVKFD